MWSVERPSDQLILLSVDLARVLYRVQVIMARQDEIKGIDVEFCGSVSHHIHKYV